MNGVKEEEIDIIWIYSCTENDELEVNDKCWGEGKW